MKKAITDLPLAFRNCCEAVDDLTEILRQIYAEVPYLFPKPIEELGASEKLKMASAILKLNCQ